MSNIEQLVQQEIIQTINADLLPQISVDVFHEELAKYIHELINHDFEKLVNILYRIDVSEQKIRSLLSSHAADSGLLIAELIIERQLQKIKSRKEFNQREKNISDDEKW